MVVAIICFATARNVIKVGKMAHTIMVIKGEQGRWLK